MWKFTSPLLPPELQKTTPSCEYWSIAWLMSDCPSRVPVSCEPRLKMIEALMVQVGNALHPSEAIEHCGCIHEEGADE